MSLHPKPHDPSKYFASNSTPHHTRPVHNHTTKTCPSMTASARTPPLRPPPSPPLAQPPNTAHLILYPSTYRTCRSIGFKGCRDRHYPSHPPYAYFRTTAELSLHNRAQIPMLTPSRQPTCATSNHKALVARDPPPPLIPDARMPDAAGWYKYGGGGAHNSPRSNLILRDPIFLIQSSDL